MHSYFTKENLKKISLATVIGTATYAFLQLVSIVLPSFNALAPSCIMVSNQTSNSIGILNGCESQQKVKVNIALGWDTGCVALPPGAIYQPRWWLGKFDRLESC